MNTEGYVGGTGVPVGDSENWWDSVFQDAPGPGDNEQTLTGGQIIADEFGSPAQQAQAEAAGASPAGVAIAQGTAATGGALATVGGNILGSAEFITQILPLLVIVAVALVIVLVVKD